MTLPPRWTEAQLTEQAKIARENFRHERLEEPLEKWKTTFDTNKAAFDRLFNDFGLESPRQLTAAQLGEIFNEKVLADAFRYVAGPPISEDDLKVLAEASLAPSRISSDPAMSQRILDTILLALDPKRFPWLNEGRAPTTDERAAAIIASAALITAQRVSTDRRNEGKDVQEKAVAAFLVGMGFKQVAARSIQTLDAAPARGEFCSESLVGSRKADIPVRLFDGRLMPIECKVSNSSTNSVKRINNDAQVKAAIWHRELGTRQVVPAAVLSGVFTVKSSILSRRRKAG